MKHQTTDNPNTSPLDTVLSQSLVENNQTITPEEVHLRIERCWGGTHIDSLANGSIAHARPFHVNNKRIRG